MTPTILENLVRIELEGGRAKINLFRIIKKSVIPEGVIGNMVCN